MNTISILGWQGCRDSFQIAPALASQNFDGHVNFDQIKTNLADFCLDLMRNIYNHCIGYLENPTKTKG